MVLFLFQCVAWPVRASPPCLGPCPAWPQLTCSPCATRLRSRTCSGTGTRETHVTTSPSHCILTTWLSARPTWTSCATGPGRSSPSCTKTTMVRNCFASIAHISRLVKGKEDPIMPQESNLSDIRNRLINCRYLILIRFFYTVDKSLTQSFWLDTRGAATELAEAMLPFVISYKPE